MRRRRFGRVIAGLICVAALLPSLPAKSWSQGTQLTWVGPGGAGVGPFGNFDLDYGPRSTTGTLGTFGVHTYTAFQSPDGHFIPHTRLSFSPDSTPLQVNDRAALNAVSGAHNVSSALYPPNGGSGRFVHETASVAYHAPTKKWFAIWASFMKIRPQDTPADPDISYYGENLPGLGWIGMKTFSDVPGSTGPNPAWGPVLNQKEARLFVGDAHEEGLYQGDARNPPTFDVSSWADIATGPSDPFPNAAPRYTAYAEPGALFVGDVLYVAMTGIWCTAPDDVRTCRGDIVLVKSTNFGATWVAVGEVLDTDPGLPHCGEPIGASLRTATSLYIHPDGTKRMLVSPLVPINAEAALYQGVCEYIFYDIGQADLMPQGAGIYPPASGSTFNAGPFIQNGAATYHPFKQRIVNGRHENSCLTAQPPYPPAVPPANCKPYREFELNP